MTRPPNSAHDSTRQLAAQTWENAEALIEHFERAMRAEKVDQSLLDELVTRLRSTADAQSVGLSVVDETATRTLARSGVTVVDDHAIDAEHSLATERRVLPETRLQLTLCFERPVPFTIRQALTELCEALLDFAANIYLRSEVTTLSNNQVARDDHDRWIESLYQGSSAHDSFASIARAIASRCKIDRVSLLRTDHNHPELIACSIQSVIDRRACQVRLLEQTVANADVNSAQSPHLQAYRKQSGSKQIHIERVPNTQVTLVLERFDETESTDPLERSIAAVRPAIQSAITCAAARSQTDWNLIFSRLLDRLRRPTSIYFSIGLATVLLATCLIQVPLKIPVEGKVVSAKSQRIYAPAEGIVDDVFVSNGDIVRAGTRLIRLRSPQLDLNQRTIEGTLATARTRLDALSVGRSEREPTHSADAKVLRTEIKGLEAQLDLITKQQDDLVIDSPIDGRVDRWDLESTLIARPVAVGQFMLSVISETAGWNIELNIPDQNIGYLLEHHQESGVCEVQFRLRSDTTIVGSSTIQTIAESTHLDASGQPIVLATMPFPTTAEAKVRAGATVLADINCGNHSLAFVWFRGIVEWWRSTTWF